MYNRLELILLTGEYCNMDFQPYKDRGLYILNNTTFVLYGAGRVSHKRMMDFVHRVVTHQSEVSDTTDKYYTANQFECFDDFTLRGNDHIKFDFIRVKRGEEELVIPALTDRPVEDALSFAVTRDYTVLSHKQSIEVFKQDKERQRVQNLEEVANWKPNPSAFLNGFAIWAFAEDHFKDKQPEAVKLRFRELSKIHHPDVGGDELMFRALTAARNYLLEKSK